MTAAQNNRHARQRGNVFFIILIGIVMFAALMFTFTRGVRQGTESMSGREAELAASDIVAYGQQMQRAVERILGRSISEADLSFANAVDTNYTNPDCGDNRCLVFHTEGGAATWKDPPDGATGIYFIGPNRVGSADGTTKDIGTSARDLVLLLRVDAGVCDAINAITNKYATWVSAGSHNATTRFIGDYTVGGGTISRDNETDQPTTGCFCDGAGASCDAADPRFFYNVLMAR